MDGSQEFPHENPLWQAVAARHCSKPRQVDPVRVVEALARRGRVEFGRMAAVLRDIVGDPFRPYDPLALGDSGTRAWCDAVAVAWGAYAERPPSGALDPARLLVLADALEDAGCEDTEALAHLRAAGDLCPVSFSHAPHDGCGGTPAGERLPHYRGCHVVDRVLSRG